MYNKLYKRFSKNYLFLVFVWLLLGHGAIYAQETATEDVSGLSGLVIDQYGRPIEGVVVTIKNSDYKVVTSADGVFDLGSNYGANLVISHPNFWEKEIKAPKNKLKNKSFKVDLRDKRLKNPDTIDIPYRGSISKDGYLGAASTIYSDEMASNLSVNVLGAMAGRIPGLNITQHRGFKNLYTNAASNAQLAGWIPELGQGNYSDNSQFGFSLRGATTPVVIIDGIESELFNIDIENIESVSVQKDALSSMFLGGKSSRGVMYITTKKPISEGFKLSFTGRFGWQEPIKTPQTLSATDYTYLLNEALVNDGLGALYSAQDLEIYRNRQFYNEANLKPGDERYKYKYTHPYVNWYDEVLKNSSTIQSYNLNATGGGRTAQYYVNLGYMSEDGLFQETSGEGFNTNAKYERYLISSKINVNVLDNLKMSATIIGRVEDENEPGASYNNILNRLYKLPGTAYPIKNEDGSYAGRNAYGETNLKSETVHSGYKSANARDAWGIVNLDHDMSWLTEGLSARMVGSVASQSRSAIERTKKQAIYETEYVSETESKMTLIKGLQSQSNEYKGVYNFQYMQGQVGIDYTKTINEAHTISGSFSGDMKEILDNYQLPERIANVFLEGKYDYKKKYYGQVAINRSYLNRYGPGHRWGTFYALGLGWDVKKENFLEDVSWIDKFKIRGVFGETGNSIGRGSYFQWRQQYQSDGGWGYNQGSGFSGMDGIIENGNRLANPNLSWERAHKLNLGFDMNLFNNRLWISADFYRDMYFDLLRQRGKSIELIGLNYPNENIGKNLHKGIDLSLTYQDNVGSFNYYATFNWSITQSKVEFMDEQNVPYEYMRQTGNPTGTRYGLLTDGLLQSQEDVANSPLIPGYTVVPGDIKYVDLNGDGIVNEFDVTKIGGDKPLSFFGLNLGFEYKGFEVSALFQGTYNREIMISDAGDEFLLGFRSGDNGYSQAYQHSMLRWTPETASTATFPRLSTRSGYNNGPAFLASDFWLRSGNFIRLKNLNIAYTIPSSLSRNYLGGLKIKVFVTGQNIWTLSATKLVDPEIINFRNYPMMKGINTGINIQF